MTEKKTSVEFAQEIEDLVKNSGTTYLDAIIEYCDKNKLELEIIAKLVRQNPTLKGKLESECVDLNLVEKFAKIDF